jgi:molybdate transport system substrate-binding protein
MDKYLKVRKSIFSRSKIPFRHAFKILSIGVLFLSACSQQQSTINIAVASNFEQTLKKIIEKYPEKNLKINIIPGSSGTLTNQILNNAPYDLFLSADTDKPQLIFQKLKLKIKPKVYATGQLVLWIPNAKGTNCLQQLPQIKTLAIANPKTAPYGKATQNLLNSNAITVEKIIQTSNASNAYLYSKDQLTQAGFVPYSMVKKETKGCIQVFKDLELKQSMILLNDKAKSFYNHMQSADTQGLIESLGYTSGKSL